MLSYPVILAITIVGLVVVSIVAYFASGTILSLFVILAIASLVYYLLTEFGVLSFKMGTRGIDIGFHENAPAPASASGSTLNLKKHKAKPIESKEVFYIEGNKFTYNDAPAVCAAYGAELATYDQVSDMFAKGAEWCGYGWSQGGMALFPTQESTWAALQQEVDESKRTVCGRPGVNGGYFDPSLKFGVNCYGVKPDNKGTVLPTPLPGTDPSAFNKMVDKFKKMLNSLTVSPFNRDVWSESGELKYEASQAKKNAVSGITTFENDIMKIGSDIEQSL